MAINDVWRSGPEACRAGAVTVQVSRAALAASAKEVVLFTNAAHPTSNALHRRIGFGPVTDFAAYDFG
ncbi:GNAT family N-acetyltransferase [Streptomyces sp. NBC_00151]|jgi:predicted GNAT family acetyltransferase|uniref:GNAT family N-acetyltransferase n=1 Tax=Streptomyces sp. NBC_00151 TaxID=2975669 RepID=UPI003FA34DC7